MKKLIFLFLFLNLVIQAQEKYITTSDGVNLYVKVKGTGKPCLYIHGGPGSGSHWLEKFSGDMLEDRFQMIYLDQRGVCRSISPKDSNYTMDRMVKDYEEVRAALGIEKWIIMGHSFGGFLQMGYAKRFPQSIEGMIMVNCSLNMREAFKKSWVPKACEFLGITDIEPFLDESKPLMDRWDILIGKLNEKNIMWKMGFASEDNMKIMNATSSEISNWNHDFSNVALSFEDYWGNFKLSCSQIRLPVLFFYGRFDRMIGPEHYKDVNFPNMMLWGSDVGHIPFMENKEDLKNAIDAYLEKYKL